MHELKNLSDQELKKRIIDEEENLSHLKFQQATSQLASPIKVRLVRRDIARMKTLLHMRALEQARQRNVGLPAVAPVRRTSSLEGGLWQAGEQAKKAEK